MPTAPESRVRPSPRRLLWSAGSIAVGEIGMRCTERGSCGETLACARSWRLIRRRGRRGGQSPTRFRIVGALWAGSSARHRLPRVPAGRPAEPRVSRGASGRRSAPAAPRARWRAGHRHRAPISARVNLRRASISQSGRSRRSRNTSPTVHPRPNSGKSPTAMFNRAAAAARFKGRAAEPLRFPLVVMVLNAEDGTHRTVAIRRLRTPTACAIAASAGADRRRWRRRRHPRGEAGHRRSSSIDR